MDPLVVRVVSRRLPTMSWHCSTCSRREEFENTEKFRANANGKVIDIWLIYRCSRCGERKNLSVIERTPVGRVAAHLLQSAQDNDAVLARGLGRDLSLMRRNRVQVANGDAWDIPDAPDVPSRAGQQLSLHFEEPMLVRLDHVMARTLGVGRQDMRDLIARAYVEVTPDVRTDRLRLWNEALVVLRHSG